MTAAFSREVTVRLGGLPPRQTVKGTTMATTIVRNSALQRRAPDTSSLAVPSGSAKAYNQRRRHICQCLRTQIYSDSRACPCDSSVLAIHLHGSTCERTAYVSAHLTTKVLMMLFFGVRPASLVLRAGVKASSAIVHMNRQAERI
jgi:hypothetical protein